MKWRNNRGKKLRRRGRRQRRPFCFAGETWVLIGQWTGNSGACVNHCWVPDVISSEGQLGICVGPGAAKWANEASRQSRLRGGANMSEEVIIFPMLFGLFGFVV